MRHGRREVVTRDNARLLEEYKTSRGRFLFTTRSQVKDYDVLAHPPLEVRVLFFIRKIGKGEQLWKAKESII